jgi:hypothetical protein
MKIIAPKGIFLFGMFVIMSLHLGRAQESESPEPPDPTMEQPAIESTAPIEEPIATPPVDAQPTPPVAATPIPATQPVAESPPPAVVVMEPESKKKREAETRENPPNPLIEKYFHGTWQYAMPYLEFGFTQGFRGKSIYYREKGGWLAESLINAGSAEGARQNAVRSGASTYTYNTVSSNALGFTFYMINIVETDDSDYTDGLFNVDLFYSWSMLEKKLGGTPTVWDVGAGFPWNIYLNTIWPMTKWAQGEVMYAYGILNRFEASVVGNLTDKAFVRTTYGFFGGLSGIQLTYGVRL